MKKLFVIGFMSASFPLWGTLFPVSPDTSQAAAKKKYLQVDDAAEGTVYAYEFPAVVPQVRVKVPGSSSWEVPYSPCYGNSLGNVEGGVNRWGDTLLVIYRNEETEEYEFRYFDLLGNPLSPAYSLGQAERVWGFRHNLDLYKGVIITLEGNDIFLSQVSQEGILESHFLFNVAGSMSYLDLAMPEPSASFPAFQRLAIAWVQSQIVMLRIFTYFSPLSPIIRISPDSLPGQDPSYGNKPLLLRAIPEGVIVAWVASVGWDRPAVYRGVSWSGNQLSDPVVLAQEYYGFQYLLDVLSDSLLAPSWIVLAAADLVWIDPPPPCSYGFEGLSVYTGQGDRIYFKDFWDCCSDFMSMKLKWLSEDTFNLRRITATIPRSPSNDILSEVYPLGEDYVSDEQIDDERGASQVIPVMSLFNDQRVWILWVEGGQFKIRSFDPDGNALIPQVDDGYASSPVEWYASRSLAATSSGLAIGKFEYGVDLFGSYSLNGLRTLDLDGNETSSRELCYADIYPEECSDLLLSASGDLIAAIWEKDTFYLRTYDGQGNELSSAYLPYLPNGILVLEDGSILTLSRQNDSLALRVIDPQGEWITDYLTLCPIGSSFKLRADQGEEGKYLIAYRAQGSIIGYYYFWPQDSAGQAFAIENTEWASATSWDAAAGPGSRVLVVWVKEREGPCGTTKDIWIYRKNIPNQSEGWLFDEPAFERRRPQVEVGDSTLWIAWQERKLGTMNSDVYVMVENMPPVNVKGPVSITGVQKFRVLGSPTTGTLALTVPPLPKGSRIEVFDIAGRRVFQHPVGLTDGGKVYLSLKLPSGNYFVLLKNGKETLLGPLPFTVLR